MKFKNKPENNIVSQYNDCINNAAYEFYIKYYLKENDKDIQSDYEYYVDIFQYKSIANLISIGDDYWCITDILIALEYDIPKNIVHKWYSDYLDYNLEGSELGFPNLYNYYKLHG